METKPGLDLAHADSCSQEDVHDWLELAASVFTHSHDGIIITDAAGIIVEINPAFTAITGYGRAEVIGRSPNLLRSGLHDAAFYRTMWEALGQAGRWHGEIFNRRKNGEILPELLTISAVRAEDGSLRHYVAVFADISQLKHTQRELEHLAHYDQLTNLLNRSLLVDRMAHAMALARRCGNLAAVCYLDLDGFKPINDRHGHCAGDRVLVETAERLRQAVRGGDTVARIGGDEFVLLLSGIETVGELDIVLDRLLATVAVPIAYGDDGTGLQVTASIGVTIFPHDGNDPDTLLRHADHAMYLAKQAGRATWHIFDAEQHRCVHVHHETRAGLRRAFDDRQFVLHYQPIVALRDGRVAGVEALIRWRHPEDGLLPPARFLPMLDGTELALELDRWVLETVLAQAAEWQKAGMALPVSVNVSPRLLKQISLDAWLMDILAGHPGVAPDRIELDIPETAATDDLHRANNMLACARLGVACAIDDFGVGYASLTHLRRMRAGAVKIDRSFIAGMLSGDDSLATVRGLLGMAAAMGRRAVAKGVETPEQGRLLAALGCDLAQGFGLCPPLPADRLPVWLAQFALGPDWRPDTA